MADITRQLPVSTLNHLKESKRECQNLPAGETIDIPTPEILLICFHESAYVFFLLAPVSQEPQSWCRGTLLVGLVWEFRQAITANVYTCCHHERDWLVLV